MIDTQLEPEGRRSGLGQVSHRAAASTVRDDKAAAAWELYDDGNFRNGGSRMFVNPPIAGGRLGKDEQLLPAIRSLERMARYLIYCMFFVFLFVRSTISRQPAGRFMPKFACRRTLVPDVS